PATLCCSARHLPLLHSLPTRRSSDLLTLDEQLEHPREQRGRHPAAVVPDTDPQLAALVEPRRQPDVAAGIGVAGGVAEQVGDHLDRKSTRLNSSHVKSSYAVFCLKKK